MATRISALASKKAEVAIAYNHRLLSMANRSACILCAALLSRQAGSSSGEALPKQTHLTRFLA